MYNLDRFKQAQESQYASALEEVRRGHKETHWMWYIFPQAAGLGCSATSVYYGISGLDEAKAYLADPLLGKRLLDISAELLHLEQTNPKLIFGRIDSLKLQSCMTLFLHAADDERQKDVFRRVLEKFFDGKEDKETLRILAKISH